MMSSSSSSRRGDEDYEGSENDSNSNSNLNNTTNERTNLLSTEKEAYANFAINYDLLPSLGKTPRGSVSVGKVFHRKHHLQEQKKMDNFDVRTLSIIIIIDIQ